MQCSPEHTLRHRVAEPGLLGGCWRVKEARLGVGGSHGLFTEPPHPCVICRQDSWDRGLFQTVPLEIKVPLFSLRMPGFRAATAEGLKQIRQALVMGKGCEPPQKETEMRPTASRPPATSHSGMRWSGKQVYCQHAAVPH